MRGERGGERKRETCKEVEGERIKSAGVGGGGGNNGGKQREKGAGWVPGILRRALLL